MSCTGILLIGHGSKTGSNESVARMHAEHLRCAGHQNVHYAFKGYSEPHIGDSLAEMSARGVDDVTVVPLFIAKGHYSDSVIPKRVGLRKSERAGAVQIEGREARIRIAGTFGCHPMVADILKDMASETYRGAGDAVLLIGHGSKTGDNKAMVELNAERLRALIPTPVFCAFNEFESPSVEDSLAEIERAGASRVIAIPMFVSSGEHTDHGIPEKLGMDPGSRAGHVRGMDVAYLAPVGSRPEIGRVLEDMLRAE